MKDIQEFYTKVEEPNADAYSFEADLRKLIGTSEPPEVLNALLEHDVLENGYYIADEHQFWPGVRRYKFDKLHFNSNEELEQYAIHYLQGRIKATTNVLLKAKYNQLLWFSTLKNKIAHGKASIDSYLEHIKQWIEKYSGQDDDNKVIEDLRYLQMQCKTLKYRQEDFNLLIKYLVEKHEVFPGWFIYYVIEVAYDARKGLEQDFNEQCYIVLEKTFDSISQSMNDEIYELAKKYGVYLKKSYQHWHDMMGHHYYQTAIKRQEKKQDSDFLIPEFYSKAIRYFELAENKEMQAKLNSEYSKVKSDNPLKKVSFGLSRDSELGNIIAQEEENIQGYIEGLDTVGIIDFLSNNSRFMPSNTEVSNPNSFLQFAKRTNQDINSNFNHKQTDFIIDPRRLHLHLFTIRMTGHSFKHGIESKRLFSDDLLKHLETNTWLGTTDEGKIWLQLLKPGLNLFFKVYGDFICNQVTNRDELILVLDSLTTKMEGVLRAFARLNGINTTKVSDEKNEGAGDVETREIFLTELLTDKYPDFKALFEENEYQFYKTVYLKDGYNIRNNIAHSFYKIEDYTMDKLLLVMLSILRISKYKPQ
ncbi:MAG: hypothetical protein ACJ77K_19260 [Bacteroidia bacterium]